VHGTGVLSSTGEQGEEGLYGTGSGVMVIPHDRWMAYKRRSGGWRGPQHAVDSGGGGGGGGSKKDPNLPLPQDKDDTPPDMTPGPDSGTTKSQKTPDSGGGTTTSSSASAAMTAAASAVSAVAASAKATTRLAAAAPEVAAAAVQASARQQAAAIERGNRQVVAELKQVRVELRQLQKATVRAFRDASQQRA
jgi:hypothetical protein